MKGACNSRILALEQRSRIMRKSRRFTAEEAFCPITATAKIWLSRAVSTLSLSRGNNYGMPSLLKNQLPRFHHGRINASTQHQCHRITPSNISTAGKVVAG